MQVDQLIAELVTTGTMNEETTVELNRMLDDWRDGQLHPDDESYIRALHARIIHGEVPHGDSAEADAGMLDGQTIVQWRDRALRAEAKLAQGDGGD